LILHADNPSSADDLKTALMATGKFNSLDLYDFNVNPNVTLADIQDYDAIIVYINIFQDDCSNVKQALEDYMDLGGGVVTCFGSNIPDISNLNLGSDYAVVGTAVSYYFGIVSLSNVYDPLHPVMDGITALSLNNVYHTGASLNLASTLIADWDNG